MTDYCDVCGEKITEEDSTSYSNVCTECAGAGCEIIMNLLG